MAKNATWDDLVRAGLLKRVTNPGFRIGIFGDTATPSLPGAVRHECYGPATARWRTTSDPLAARAIHRGVEYEVIAWVCRKLRVGPLGTCQPESLCVGRAGFVGEARAAPCRGEHPDSHTSTWLCPLIEARDLDAEDNMKPHASTATLERPTASPVMTEQDLHRCLNAETSDAVGFEGSRMLGVQNCGEWPSFPRRGWNDGVTRGS
jgi:hypothetical protein